MKMEKLQADLTESEIKAAMPESNDKESYIIWIEEDGCYSIYLETTAPLPDNIEGH